MEKRDLVIGAVTGYNFSQIAPWVNSLDRSGYTGHKCILAYNMEYATAQELSRRGYSILAFQQDEHTQRLLYPKQQFSIVVERFLHYYLFLDTPEMKNSVRFVVATDVKDVIFQRNPSDYLNSLSPFIELDESIIASSEELTYEQEPWGMNNLTQAFGKAIYDKHKYNTIYNAGVIAGRFDAFMGLCKSIYLVSAGAPQFVQGGGGPDQAALNLLLSTVAYESVTKYTNHNGTWAAQLGTTMDPRKLAQFEPFLKNGKPRFDVELGLVVNPSGTPYTIVHQWDRVPEVKSAVERMYV